jgi:hypothetical protein
MLLAGGQPGDELLNGAALVATGTVIANQLEIHEYLS